MDAAHAPLAGPPPDDRFPLSRVEPVEGRVLPDAVPAAAPIVPELADLDRRVLAFERQWWRYAGAKEQAIRAEFRLSATRYYQLLNIVIDQPAALVADPMLVRRLRRLRDQRRRARSGRPS